MGKRFLTRKLKRILLAALLIAVAVTLAAAITQSATTGENVLSVVLSPIRGGVAAMDRQAERIYGYLFRYEALKAENEALKKELADGAADARTGESYRRENERLRELLSLSEEHEDYKFSAAYIVSWSSSGWQSTVTVSRGSSSGLQKGMCAVTGTSQVVGVITDLGPNWATVTTIYDPSVSLSASVTASGCTGVVQGARDENGKSILKMSYLSTTAALKTGDAVVTNSSTLYPRGLLLGTVAQSGLDETGAAKYAVLDCAMSPDSLEQLFFITEYTAQ